MRSKGRKMMCEMYAFIIGIKRALEFKKIYYQWYIYDIILITVYASIYAILDSKQTFTFYLTYVLILLYSDLFPLWKLRHIYDEDIKKGNLLTHLVKPYNYLLFRFFYLLGLDIRTLTLIILVPFIFFPLSHALSYFIFLFFSLILSYLFNISISLLSFYLYEPDGVVKMLYLIRWFLQGALLPTYFFPSYFKGILNYTVFAFIGYLNHEVLVNGISFILSPSYIIAYFFNLFFFFSLVLFLWKKGLKRFEAQCG